MTFLDFDKWKPRMTQIRTVIVRGDRHFLVSTVDTLDAGFETMVFACDAEGDSVDYTDLDAERYTTAEEAAAGHAVMCERFQP